MPSREPEQIHTRFQEASNSRDLEALVALYEPDAILAAAPDQIVRGTEAIREAYRGFLSMNPTIAIETLRVFHSNEGIAMLHGRWSLSGTGPDGEVRMQGRNTEVVRRQTNGDWLFLIDNPFSPE